MKALIIEDEKPAADKIKQLLKKVDENIMVVDTLETVEDSINWLRSNPQPDLIFMDVQLNDGICFEIFEMIKIETPIIFTTGYDKYAIQAFKVNSIDYLLKPIDLDALKLAIGKYKSLFAKGPVDNEKINHIYKELTKQHKTRFFVKAGPHFNSVLTDDIECFYIKERCTFLRTFNGKNYDLDYSLEQIQNLVKPNQFFRINRSFIVNINSINNIAIYSSNRLKIMLKNEDNNYDLIVSREKVAEFKEWLNK